MSTTDTDETRANQDPREEPEWSSDEGGLAQQETMREGFESADDEEGAADRRFDEVRSDSAYPGQPTESEDESESEDEDGDEDDAAEPEVVAESGDDEADDADEADESAESASSPAYEYGEFSRNAGTTESEQPSASDDALDTDGALTSGTYSQDSAGTGGFAERDDVARSEGFGGPEGVAETEDSADVAQPGGVARPEDLGGHDIGAGGEPLVAAAAQEEFLSRWTQIQVSFLEDPPAAVEGAEALIGEISAAIRTSLEERGSALAAEGQEASDTEQLRLALRQYRAFIGVILPK